MRSLSILESSFERLKAHIKLRAGSLTLDQLIQKPWAIIAALALALLPTLLVLLQLRSKQLELTALLGQIKTMPFKIERAIEKQREKQLFIQRHGSARKDYLLEAFKELNFLTSEADLLKELEALPSLASCEAIKERLAFLTGKENKLFFRQIDQRDLGEIEEERWKQGQLVELDRDDLEKLLIAIEGETHLDKPQLGISAFHLKRKGEEGRESYTLEMELTQRFLSKSRK